MLHSRCMQNKTDGVVWSHLWSLCSFAVLFASLVHCGSTISIMVFAAGNVAQVCRWWVEVKSSVIRVMKFYLMYMFLKTGRLGNCRGTGARKCGSRHMVFHLVLCCITCRHLVYGKWFRDVVQHKTWWKEKMWTYFTNALFCKRWINKTCQKTNDLTM
jgi:hypothetical protein